MKNRAVVDMIAESGPRLAELAVMSHSSISGQIFLRVKKLLHRSGIWLERIAAGGRERSLAFEPFHGLQVARQEKRLRRGDRLVAIDGQYLKGRAASAASAVLPCSFPLCRRGDDRSPQAEEGTGLRAPGFKLCLFRLVLEPWCS